MYIENESEDALDEDVLHFTLKEAIEKFAEIDGTDALHSTEGMFFVYPKSAVKSGFGLVEDNHYLPLCGEHDIRLMLSHPEGIDGARYEGIRSGDRVTINGALCQDETGIVSFEVWNWKKLPVVIYSRTGRTT